MDQIILLNIKSQETLASVAQFSSVTQLCPTLCDPITGQAGHQEADDSRWSSSHFGHCTNQNVHASSQGSAHTQGHQVEGVQMSFGTLRLCSSLQWLPVDQLLTKLANILMQHPRRS